MSDSQQREQVIRRNTPDFLDASRRLDPMIYPALRDLFQYTGQQRSLFPFVTYDAPVVKGKKLR